jgi:hypothetical protein
MSLRSRARRVQKEIEGSYQKIHDILRDKGEDVKAKLDQGLTLAEADLQVVTEELQRRGQKPIV